jgi:hypothetical protein
MPPPTPVVPVKPKADDRAVPRSGRVVSSINSAREETGMSQTSDATWARAGLSDLVNTVANAVSFDEIFAAVAEALST